MADITWIGNLYHGLPKHLFKPSFKAGKYLSFLGRISAEKRVDRAIKIAIDSGIPIRIAAKIAKEDEDYFKYRIKKLLKHPLVEFIGEIGEHEKNEFLSDSIALLFPIDWPEPFGLVMIEALACGTPVIAYNKGSVPEIIDNGSTGFIVDNEADAVHAVKNISLIDRVECRRVFEERFAASRMAADYIKVYNHIMEQDTHSYDLKILQS